MGMKMKTFLFIGEAESLRGKRNLWGRSANWNRVPHSNHWTIEISRLIDQASFFKIRFCHYIHPGGFTRVSLIIEGKDIPKKYPVGSDITIQVTKGPIGTKGPRVTTHLAIPGRYLVILPNTEQCGISKKIEDKQERARLREIIRDLDIPDNMGVIIRTAGEGQKKRYFVRDLAMLA